MYEKILVPLDGSKSAEAVLEHIQQLAQGSVADTVVRKSKAPVLLVRAATVD